MAAGSRGELHEKPALHYGLAAHQAHAGCDGLPVEVSYVREKTEITPHLLRPPRAIPSLSTTYTQKQFLAISANTAEQEHSDYICLL